jgi:hypothetical protein
LRSVITYFLHIPKDQKGVKKALNQLGNQTGFFGICLKTRKIAEPIKIAELIGEVSSLGSIHQSQSATASP